MDDPWKVLEGAGLPEGAVRPAPEVLDGAQVRAAVHALTTTLALAEPAHREPLLAWLKAFRHHWPRRFEEILGADGRDLIAQLESDTLDAGRYLKLRRIAIANLSGCL